MRLVPLPFFYLGGYHSYAYTRPDACNDRFMAHDHIVLEVVLIIACHNHVVDLQEHSAQLCSKKQL